MKHIAVDDIPKRFGGNQEWEFGMHPQLDEETRLLVGEMGSEWVEGPVRYISTGEHDVIEAVGVEDGRERRKIIATFAKNSPMDVCIEKI